MSTPKNIGYSLLKIFIVCAIILGASETILQWKSERSHKEENERLRYYSWFVADRWGHPLSAFKGALKLVINPQRVYANAPNQKQLHFTTNSRGLRGGEVLPVNRLKMRIIVLGGSTAFGSGLDRDSDALPAQLGARLKGTESINAAVIGYQSGQELSYLVTEMIDLSPDLVISFGGWNDYASNVERPSSWTDVNGADQMQIKIHLFYRLAYSPRPERILAQFQMMFPLTAAMLDRGWKNIRHRSKKSYHAIDQAGWMEAISLRYATNMNKMRVFSKAFHAGFLCVLQPVRGRQHDWRYARVRTLAKIQLEALGVPYLDLNGVDYPIPNELFFDEVHLNAAGNRLVAQYVADEIVKRRLLLRKRSPG